MPQIGVIVIGRNEGDRLRICLESVQPEKYLVIYVDSGSTDGSVALARSMGVDVVSLDLTVPFTAARARNMGLKRLLEIGAEGEFVQFIDGDCELNANWMEFAQKNLEERSDLAVVCGRRRERFPEQSVYNRLCDIEWNTPVGEALSCGGDALMRLSAIRQAGGYREELIAGEEPELCLRMRIQGWKIDRLDHEMTLHDAAMTRFGQWWKRTLRAGHAYAEVSSLHRHSPLKLWQRETRSNWIWGLIIPLLAILPIPFTWGLSSWLLLLYPLLFFRIRRRQKQLGTPCLNSYSFFCLLAKLPMMLGQMKFCINKLFRRRARIIEYK